MSTHKLNTVLEIHRAVFNKNLRAVSRILSKDPSAIKLRDVHSNTPLHVACTKQDLEMVKLLLSRKADTRARNHHKSTPLHMAASKKFGAKLVELLLQHRSPINQTDKYGNTPLHVAATRGNKEILELLLSAGANLNAMNNEFQMPLSIAKRLQKKACIDGLLKHGATIENSPWEIIKFSFRTLKPLNKTLLVLFIAVALGSTTFITILTAGMAAVSIPIAILACMGVAIILIGKQYFKVRTLESRLMNAEITFNEFLKLMSLKNKD